METVTPAQGHERVQQGALLVDVREPDEFASGHAQGALSMPLSNFEAQYSTLPKDRALVMICRSGARSARAAEHLLSSGYTQVANLEGGTLAWQDAGLPMGQ